MVSVEEGEENPLTRYTSGSDRFANFTEEILGVNLLEIQKEILRAVANNRRVMVVSGNGVGKTYAVAALELSFLYTHSEAMVLHTSRSNGHTRNTTYREIREMYQTLEESEMPFGYNSTLKKQPMEIEFEDSQTRKYEAVSPANPDGLEGRHSENFLAVVDEADKKEIGEDVIESAESSLTDENDRMLVIGNPPRSKGNSLYRLMNSEHWKVIQFSSFDCDNVKIATGEMDGDIVSGPIQLTELKYDWEKYHDNEWESLESVLAQSAPYVDDEGDYSFVDHDDSFDDNDEFRTDLAEAWYRRRCGIIPPKGAVEARPFYSSDVDEAVDRWDDTIDSQESLDAAEYDAIGVDVAGRGEDSTVIVGVTRASASSVGGTDSGDGSQSASETGRADVLGEFSASTETENERMIRSKINNAEDTPIVFDAVGMGGPVADTFRSEGFSVVRFDGNKRAKDDERYYNQRTEAWDEFGDWLLHGAISDGSKLANELYGTAECIALEEKGLRSGTSLMATSKDEVKLAENYGESPDFLDSASYAVWGMNHNPNDWGEASWSITTI